MEWLYTFSDWVGAHPGWAWVAVFAIACGESLALVGLLLPGVLLMFAVGALIGHGVLPFWPTMAWACAGAIAGDGISFWLGRHYHQQLRAMWPFRRHPKLMARAVDFFSRHGSKSVVFARFVGPIRPILPAVAGMMEMPPRTFLTVNLLSALLWAPLYLLPGMIFAASLDLAAEAAGRLALLLGSLLLLLFFSTWLAKQLFLFLHEHTYPWLQRLLLWSEAHPRLGRLPSALLDPDHPEARGLSLWALLLLAAVGLFVLLLRTLHAGGLLPNLNEYLGHALGNLHTPLMDQWLGNIALCFEPLPLLGLFGLNSLLLALYRRRYTLGHWLAAGLFALLVPPLLQTLGIDSGPLAALVLYGFYIVLLGRGWEVTPRLVLYMFSAPLLTLPLIARLYLEQDQLADTLVALTLGMAWVALLNIAFHRHTLSTDRALHWPALPPLLMLLLVLLLPQETAPIETPIPQASIEGWQASDWKGLPAWRRDLRGQQLQPLNLHYLGDLSALATALKPAGWQPPPSLADGGWLRWLSRASIDRLPVLSQVHDGYNEALLLVRADESGEGLLALRLWPLPSRQGLWLGNISHLQLMDERWLRVPRTVGEFALAREQLVADLEGLASLRWRRVRNTQGVTVLQLELRPKD